MNPKTTRNPPVMFSQCVRRQSSSSSSSCFTAGADLVPSVGSLQLLDPLASCGSRRGSSLGLISVTSVTSVKSGRPLSSALDSASLLCLPAKMKLRCFLFSRCGGVDAAAALYLLPHAANFLFLSLHFHTSLASKETIEAVCCRPDREAKGDERR